MKIQCDMCPENQGLSEEFIDATGDWKVRHNGKSTKAELRRALPTRSNKQVKEVF